MPRAESKPSTPTKSKRVPIKVGKPATTVVEAALTDPNKPLTEQQRQFVLNWASGESISVAAVKAGFNDNSSYAYRMAAQPSILAAYHAEKVKYEASADMSRKKVMEGLLDGIELAKLEGSSASVIQGWKTVGQMCGYFEPVKHRIEVSVTGAITLDRINQLSDEELIKMIEAGTQAMLPAPDSDEA